VANDEPLALLRQGSAIWNEWCERNRDRPPADLSDADLSQADLAGVNLSKANLNRANLHNANLYKANLRQAQLHQANLSWANLSYANLSWAVGDANLASANLSRATLDFAHLDYANLKHANLSYANLSDALLNYADLSYANLSRADLSRAKLLDTIFGEADLSETVGLDQCVHYGPSIIDFRTLSRSRNLPISFLRGCGLPDILIDYLPSLRDDAIQFYSCFISYSAKDQVFADRLHADLQNKGVRCWFAPHDLPIGAKTWDAIDEAIRLRDKLLLILSKASIASEWVEDEVNRAYAEERSRKENVLFPIHLDNAVISTDEPWAVKLRDQRNIGDFRQWRKPAEYQKSLDRLLRDLKASGAK
jgi:uncharacterized protein YjbI with pentapeptide repeats